MDIKKSTNVYRLPGKDKHYPSSNTKDRLLVENRGRFEADQYQVTIHDNNSTFNYQPFFSGLALINTRLKKHADEDDYIENSIHCLSELIGNKHTAYYGFVGMTDEKGVLCLPYRAESIEYVSNGREDFTTWSYKGEMNQLYPPGGYVSYKFLGDRIETNYFNQYVSVLYKSVRIDEDGFPAITPKEAMALAHWWNFVDLDAKVFAQKVNPALADRALLRANTAILQAKVPEKYSQNFIDNLYDIVYSRDGKVYNHSYKMIKNS